MGSVEVGEELLTIAITYHPGTGIAEIHLPPARLLEWPGWDNPSREFIASKAGPIEMTALLDDYHSAVAELYRWLASRQGEMHSLELEQAIRVAKALGHNVRRGA